jgi:hypothetical protein
MGCEERKAKGSLEVGLVSFTCSPTYLTDHYTWASGSCFPDRRYFGFNHAPPTKVVGGSNHVVYQLSLKSEPQMVAFTRPILEPPMGPAEF